MGRPPAVEGETAELCRITVAADLQERLAHLAMRTGSSQSWHRRKALQNYLDLHEPAEASA